MTTEKISKKERGKCHVTATTVPCKQQQWDRYRVPQNVFLLDMTCCLCTEGQVVHTLSEGPAFYGMTSLGEEIYLVRLKRGLDGVQVEVYDVISYRLLHCLTVPNARGVCDMTSCEHFLCLYIADPHAECIHRLDLQGNSRQWPVNDEPRGLSVNADHHLIVTCPEVRKIKQFSPRGDLLRDVTLPDDVINPWHAIQLTNGQFIVCHGDGDDPIHRVCKVSEDGGHIIDSHGGERGKIIGQYSEPRHLAVDDNEFVFVVEINNRRVTLLSPTLEYERQVVSRDQFKWKPRRLHLDVQRRRMYVTDIELKHGKRTAGRVLVFSV